MVGREDGSDVGGKNAAEMDANVQAGNKRTGGSTGYKAGSLGVTTAGNLMDDFEGEATFRLGAVGCSVFGPGLHRCDPVFF